MGGCGSLSGGWCRASADPVLEIVDHVRIPTDITPGRYVLGWRYVTHFLAEVCSARYPDVVLSFQMGLRGEQSDLAIVL